MSYLLSADWWYGGNYFCEALETTAEDVDGDTKLLFGEVFCFGNESAIVLVGPFFTPDELGSGNDLWASFGEDKATFKWAVLMIGWVCFRATFLLGTGLTEALPSRWHLLAKPSSSSLVPLPVCLLCANGSDGATLFFLGGDASSSLITKIAWSFWPIWSGVDDDDLLLAPAGRTVDFLFCELLVEARGADSMFSYTIIFELLLETSRDLIASWNQADVLSITTILR